LSRQVKNWPAFDVGDDPHVDPGVRLVRRVPDEVVRSTRTPAPAFPASLTCTRFFSNAFPAMREEALSPERRTPMVPVSFAAMNAFVGDPPVRGVRRPDATANFVYPVNSLLLTFFTPVTLVPVTVS
jgi:hypothetical protein